MKRVSDVMSKHVLAESGEKLGKVSDVLLDTRGRRIAGFVLREGWLARERVLPFRDVRTLGESVVLVQPGPESEDPHEWSSGERPHAWCRDVRGIDVVTAAGSRLGTLTDLVVDEETGVIEELEVGHDESGVMKRWSRVAAGPDVSIGSDAVVLPPEQDGAGG